MYVYMYSYIVVAATSITQLASFRAVVCLVLRFWLSRFYFMTFAYILKFIICARTSTLCFSSHMHPDRPTPRALLALCQRKHKRNKKGLYHYDNMTLHELCNVLICM